MLNKSTAFLFAGIILCAFLTWVLGYVYVYLPLGVIIFGYVVLILLIDRTLKVNKYEFWLIPLVYLATTVYIAVLFTIALTHINASLHKEITPTAFDYFYFSVISLTSVGYGDFTPQSVSEKLVAITMALVGTAHMVVFVALIMSKISEANSKNASPKEQQPKTKRYILELTEEKQS
ncbi:two pore domain potassium channel family protein [Vibrio parahaemolyticus]|uniref:Two pore domain potassium channel family protein n=2 Tax=Vibrio parahaemolyticus TaxID=670 RepID=A0AAX1FS18_VIBPH|nr:potassium channel family protein [Vibrio parahaemolyticus]EIU6780227.1 two pore domain potassium channel family protein [Vibrio parahaemolyticus]MCR9725668.1 potassium channel family protein [Vibrio parahaemolyticus]MCR9742707.1 potassium channel family protein [Vibrio parahaemolyticus]QHH09809.1 two pore domain potassium channel family protein [Vibrio parahaemolyticus]QHH09812.1 two pore domain potassium channel family protein [Vibrio parahaemolyticus]